METFFGVTSKKKGFMCFLQTLGAIFAQICEKSRVLGVRLHPRLLHECLGIRMEKNARLKPPM